MLLKYCTWSSIVRKNPRVQLFDDRISKILLIQGYTNKFKMETRGISFSDNGVTHLVFVSTSNLEDTSWSLIPELTQVDHGLIHKGYYERTNLGLFTSVMYAVHRLGNTKVILTGHSLGGAMAGVVGYRLSVVAPHLDIKIVTFGSPKWGNTQLAKYMQKVDVTNYINTADPVPVRPRDHRFVRIGGVKSGTNDTNNDSKNHGIRVYREIVSGSQVKFQSRPHRFDEILSRWALDNLS